MRILATVSFVAGVDVGNLSILETGRNKKPFSYRGNFNPLVRPCVVKPTHFDNQI